MTTMLIYTQPQMETTSIRNYPSALFSSTHDVMKPCGLCAKYTLVTKLSLGPSNIGCADHRRHREQGRTLAHTLRVSNKCVGALGAATYTACNVAKGGAIEEGDGRGADGQPPRKETTILQRQGINGHRIIEQELCLRRKRWSLIGIRAPPTNSENPTQKIVCGNK